MRDPHRAVFLSYASQDAEAAKRIAESLRAADVEVWFDQSELVGGDAWDVKIRKQIRECALFVPILSRTTQGRREAYFRLEWKLADERTHLMATGTPFLLPITIDETSDRDAIVPDSFLAVQWTKAPAGEVPAAFGARVKKLLDGEPVGPTVRHAVPDESRPGAAPVETRLPRGVRPVLVTLAVLVIAVLGYMLRRALDRPVNGKVSQNTPPAATATPVLSEARQLAEKADALANRNGVNTEELAAAAELCDRALALDATDGKVWATASFVDTKHVFTGFDRSEARRQQALRKAARAMALAPESVEARWANAFALGYAGTPAMRIGAITIAAGLVKERPDDRQLLVGYGTLLRDAQRYDEAAAIFERAGSDQSAGWNYFSAGRMTDARRMADRVLAHGPSSGGALLKTFVESIGFEDPAAAAAAVGLFTPTDLLDASPFRSAVLMTFYGHDPERMLRLVDAFPQDFLFVNGAGEPKRYYSGLAQEMAGRPDAARAEWSLALRQVKQRLGSQPNDPDLLAAQALLLACLGERAESAKTLDLFNSLVPEPDDDYRSQWIVLRLGRNEEALTRLQAKLHGKKPGWRFSHFEARFDPRWEALRNDPRLQALLRETRWPEAKPFDDAPGGPVEEQKIAAAVPEKSVAVLSFANLSDDKANEYFSDGISEELINVLAKVTGLKVTARTLAFYFKAKNVPIPEIAEKLGVACIVEGSVRKSGDRVRITAQLIKAADDFHVWNDRLPGDQKVMK